MILLFVAFDLYDTLTRSEAGIKPVRVAARDSDLDSGSDLDSDSDSDSGSDLDLDLDLDSGSGSDSDSGPCWGSASKTT